MPEWAITTDRLTCHHGATLAVRDLTLRVPSGSIYGLLGRNGVGKSTALQTLLGLHPPTSGTGTILGAPITAIPPALRSRIGYLSEHHPAYPWMRVVQWECYQRRCFPTWLGDRFAAILDHFRITPRQPVSSLSRGQRAGLCLATVLAPDPELLVLDDPLLGLDPVARTAMVEALVFLTRRPGRTALIASHQLADIERVVDRIGVIDAGQLLADCTLDHFRERIACVRLQVQAHASLSAIPGLLTQRRCDDGWEITYVRQPDSDEVLRTVGTVVQDVPLTLEEAFIAYAGEHGEVEPLLARLGDVS